MLRGRRKAPGKGREFSGNIVLFEEDDHAGFLRPASRKGLGHGGWSMEEKARVGRSSSTWAEDFFIGM